jgi:FkbM family methyltransferase
MAFGRSLDIAGPWTWLRSGVGYHLDNFGIWLLQRWPAYGRTYASLLKPWPPKLGHRPRWRFGEEYYDQRQWLACRRGALWELARRKGLTVPLTVPWHAGTNIEVTLGNDNSLCLYVCGSFEPNEFAFLDRALKPGMVFVDVGANDGYFTTFAARKVGTTGRVIAVEPSSRERAHLSRNLSLNGISNVTVLPISLGAAPGMVELKLAHGTHAGHNTLGRFVHEDVVSGFSEQVEIKTLDEVFAASAPGRVDLIKIDVEGGEGGVIAGAAGTLRKWQPLLLLEINDGALRVLGHSADLLIDRLRSEFGYEILIWPEGGVPSVWRPGQAMSENVAAVPKARVQEFVTA